MNEINEYIREVLENNEKRKREYRESVENMDGNYITKKEEMKESKEKESKEKESKEKESKEKESKEKESKRIKNEWIK
jgi:DNA polymerase-3 subunit gamma/tau